MVLPSDERGGTDVVRLSLTERHTPDSSEYVLAGQPPTVLYLHAQDWVVRPIVHLSPWTCPSPT